MSVHRTKILQILIIFCILNIDAQEKSIKVHVHANYTDHPLISVLVNVLLHGDIIDSAYTDINCIASISIPVIAVTVTGELPASFTLGQNYPNPVKINTNVDIKDPETMTFNTAVYNTLVHRVAAEQIPVSTGYYTINLTLQHLPMGVYFLRVDGRESNAVKLIKLGSGNQYANTVISLSYGHHLARMTIGKVKEQEFTIRAIKNRFEMYETNISIPGDTDIVIQLEHHNLIEFILLPFQKDLLNTANETNLGIIGMNVAARESVFRDDGINSMEPSLHYVYSNPVSTVIVVISNLSELEDNARIIRKFQKYNEQVINTLAQHTAHYYKDTDY